MSTKKSSRGAVSKISSVTAPAVSSATKNVQKSSITKSAFSPSPLQLALFASVIQGFESQNLRIHDTNTGRLRCQHSASKGTSITSLDWGYYGTAYRESHKSSPQKKRKRGSDKNSEGNAVVAFGTSRSEICMFSPSEAKVTGTLPIVHERGVKDFRFWAEDYLQAWSLGGEGKLVQWDLKTDTALRSITLSDMNIHTIAPSLLSTTAASSNPGHPNPQILCASPTPYSINLKSSDDFEIASFDSFKNPIHTILLSDPASSGSSEAFLAADSERSINIYDINKKRLLRSLIAGSGTESLSLSSSSDDTPDTPTQLLAVTTRNGLVELFPAPFLQPAQTSGPNGTIKSKRQGLVRKAAASIKVITPDSKGVVVPVFKAAVHGPDVIIALAGGGVDVGFQRIRWQDEGTGELLFDGVKEVVKTKIASTLNAASMNGVKDVGKAHVDESKTVVVDARAGVAEQGDVIEISSTDEEEGEAASDIEDDIAEEARREGEEDIAEETGREGEEVPDLEPQEQESDTEMMDAAVSPVESGKQQDVNPDAEDEEEAAEPSFGERLAAQNPDPISIANATPAAQSSTLVAMNTAQPTSVPAGISLSKVLSQSLRTSDQNLLESCFHTTDSAIIRLTIQRLDASLAGVLLQRLAERLSSRPGRYGHLLVWVQWTCVAHGGAIASNPDVSKKVQDLYQVLSQRSRSLDSLLLLKGKLDMLDAQLSLRRQLQATRRPARDPNDEEGIIYIEGQEEEPSSDEDETAGTKPAALKAAPVKKSLDELVADSESEDDEDIPATNGIMYSDEDDSEEEEEEEGPVEQTEGGLMDEEAEESGQDSHPSDREESEEEEAVDSDEADSEMDDFIDDNSVVEVESTSEIDMDETPEKPPAKKSKRV